MKGIKNFEEFVNENLNEALDFTFGDANAEYELEDPNARKKEEKAFAKYLKYIGAKSLDDAYLAFTSDTGDDLEDEFVATGKEEPLKGSSLYDLGSPYRSRVQTGTLKGIKAFVVNDGMNSFCYVGPAGSKKF